MRDVVAQSRGAFPKSKGERLEHSGLIQFINRNYGSDEKGCWYFQNGPQRVYVELEATPFIWRITDDFSVTSQTGQVGNPVECFLDQEGKVYLNTDIGFGLVHTLDVVQVASALDNGTWMVKQLQASKLESQFGFVRSPQKVARQQQASR